jgi:tetratricopeptide (TPR) repeat protein
MAFDKAKAIRTAEKYLAQGKIPAAIQEYKRIVENESDDYTALNTLGDLYARVNQKQEAVVCYRRVAEHYREQGFTLKAVAMYKKVTRFGAGDSGTALALASLYEQQGLMADARAQYLAAADAFTRTGSSREALTALSRIADLDPEDTTNRLRLADGYAREEMNNEAAEAYTVAGERLAAREQHEWALEAFKKALALRPTLHAALQGLLGAHVALGTAEQAAEVLEQAVADSPRDVELHALLARSYIEAEDVRRAENATDQLVRLDPTSYTVFFEVARLYLQQGSVGEAIRLLGIISEQALSGNQDGPLLDLAQDVLARDPEQIAGLRLLARIYAWQREDERLRMALERLTDAAQAAGDVEEERRALAQLVRLAPDESRYASRLDGLGGAASGEAELRDSSATEVPSFESFMLHEEAFAPAPETQTVTDTATDFEWNAVGAPAAEPQPPVEPASFIFERNEADSGGEVAYDFSGTTAPQSSGFQEIDFGAAPAQAAPAPSVERMLMQELESVDFYIEQQYADIARETLDMLERQYGPHAEIERRRAALPADAAASTRAEPSTEAAEPQPVKVTAEEFEFGDAAAFDFTTLAPPALASEHETSANGNGHVPFAEIVADDLVIEPPASVSTEAPATDFGMGPPASFESAATPAPAAPQSSNGAAPSAAATSQASSAQPVAAAAQTAGGLDPGLAALFDEFRESEEGTAEEEDFETHYQMGLAYREMGLLDQAVEEFQIAAGLCAPGDGTPRYLNCCNLLGHCFIQKGMPRPAAVWFKRGLDSPGQSEDEYQALRFDLAAVFEQMGEVERAVEIFSEVYAIDVNYRGVADRLRELQKVVRGE